jgi:hypothetical protein
MSRPEIFLMIGLAELVVGLTLSLLTDWLRDRPGWPPASSILRWHGWGLLGLAAVLFGIGTLVFGWMLA